MLRFLKINFPLPVIILLLFFIFSPYAAVVISGQHLSSSLPRSTPEAEGVSSAAIINFLDAVEGSQHEFHSFMMLRHGKVIAETWWNPYGHELKHSMYSVSKSFTATAIGFAVSEKKLSVNDKVISFFPDVLPDTVSDYLRQLSVRDLLTMTVGHQTDPTGRVAANNENWARGFLAVPIVNQPGTKFLYNSLATYMLSAIVQKVTGQKVIEYLKPRLFDPLGIQGIDWESDPKGINTGGWGLRLKTEDMAKFGQLFLQKGKWKGKQLVPASWIEEASTKKIDQDPMAPQSRKDSSDWLQGYCFQMWRSRNNSYRGDGAFGQYILVIPEHDAVIAITSETSSMQGELDLVWKYLLPSFHPEKLPADSKSFSSLKSKLGSRKLALPKTEKNTLETSISGKQYNIQSSGTKVRKAILHFNNGTCRLTVSTDSTTHDLNFGNGRWVSGQTSRYGPYLVGTFKGNRKGLPEFKTMGSYAWKDNNTLVLTLRYMESPHTEFITCRFEEGDMSLEFTNSFNQSGKGVLHKGVLAASGNKRLQQHAISSVN